MSLTSFLTTSAATFSGSTSSNISAIALVASSFWSKLYGRYIIDRESPYTANEKPGADCFDAVLFSAAAADPKTSAKRTIKANSTGQSFVMCFLCFICYLLFPIGQSVHRTLDILERCN